MIREVVKLTDRQLAVLTRSHGQEKLDLWLSSLESTCQDIKDRWQCEIISTIHAGAEGLTLKGVIAGREVVVKIFVVNDNCREQIRIMELLTAAQIESTVPLLGHHRAYKTLLMPFVEGIHPKISEEIDTQVQISLNELHNSGLDGVKSMTPYWRRRKNRTEKRMNEHDVTSEKKALLDKAHKLGLHLIKTTKEPTMLHGDMYCDNMLLDGKGHIRMFDFRGFHGDAAFDYASWVAKSTIRYGFIDPLPRITLNSRERAWIQAILPGEAQLYEILGDTEASDLAWQWLTDNWLDFTF